MLKRLFCTLACVGLATAAFAHSESHEKIELKVAAGDFEPEVLVLEDFPVGATETIFTDLGNQALVTRYEDRFEIELHGERIVVETPTFTDHAFADLTDGHPAGAHRVVVIDDSEALALDGESIEDVEVLLEEMDPGDIPENAKVLVIRKEIRSEQAND